MDIRETQYKKMTERPIPGLIWSLTAPIFTAVRQWKRRHRYRLYDCKPRSA